MASSFLFCCGLLIELPGESSGQHRNGEEDISKLTIRSFRSVNGFCGLGQHLIHLLSVLGFIALHR
jgi:hypothetical protein